MAGANTDHGATGRSARMLADWRDRANCKGLGTLMDPPPDQATQDAIADAKAICYACPVLDSCRAWVLTLKAREDPGGVCAGLTEAQRTGRRYRIRHAPIPAGCKRCPRCEQTKRIEEFSRDRSNRDGRHYYCKPCHRSLKAPRAPGAGA